MPITGNGANGKKPHIKFIAKNQLEILKNTQVVFTALSFAFAKLNGTFVPSNQYSKM